MGQRRWTRLTNAFGRKWENQWAAAMLLYTYYNFCRIHRSLRVTPAMQAGIAITSGESKTSCDRLAGIMSGGRRKRKKLTQQKTKTPKVAEGSNPSAIKRLLKWAGVILTILVTASGLLPLVQPPSVATPSPVFASNPLSLTYEVTNESLLPLFAIRFSCEYPLIKDVIQNSVIDGSANQHLDNQRSILLGRQRMTGECQNGVSMDVPLVYAEAQLALSYRHFLWPFRLTSKYTFKAIIEHGRVARWIAK